MRDAGLFKSGNVCLGLCALMLTSGSIAFDLSYDKESPLTLLSESDWALLKNTAKATLEDYPDNKSNFWLNNETGNSGKITVLATDNASSLCRYTEFLVNVENKSSATKVMLCMTESGHWRETTSRETEVQTGSDPISENQSQSIMFRGDAPTLSDEDIRDKFSNSNDYCGDLLRQIDELKGKPLRRAAAIDRHEAECMR